MPPAYLKRQRRAGLLFVLPAVIYFGGVFLVPLLESVVGSFYRTVPGGASQFVGTRLYVKVLTDPTFWQAVGNTVSLLVMSVPLTVVAALAAALGLHRLRNLRARSAWAAMYFVPFSVSLVAAALVWQWIYDPVYGVLNHLLGTLGLPQLKWLQSLDLVRPSLALVNVWARLGFDTVYATTQGGPAGASQTVIMLLYDTAFKFFRLGDASVMAVFVFASLLLVTLVQWRPFRREVEY